MRCRCSRSGTCSAGCPVSCSMCTAASPMSRYAARRNPGGDAGRGGEAVGDAAGSVPPRDPVAAQQRGDLRVAVQGVNRGSSGHSAIVWRRSPETRAARWLGMIPERWAAPPTDRCPGLHAQNTHCRCPRRAQRYRDEKARSIITPCHQQTPLRSGSNRGRLCGRITPSQSRECDGSGVANIQPRHLLQEFLVYRSTSPASMPGFLRAALRWRLS